MTETKPATKRGEVVSSSQLPTIKDIKESVIILNKEDKEGKVVSTTQKNILDFWEMERLLSAHEQHAQIELNDRNYALQADDRHCKHFSKSDEAIDLEREYWRGYLEAVQSLRGGTKK
jgi:hypothetical protein